MVIPLAVSCIAFLIVSVDAWGFYSAPRSPAQEERRFVFAALLVNGVFNVTQCAYILTKALLQ